MEPTRNQIMEALLKLAASIAWTGVSGPGQFRETTRKWRDFSQFSQAETPALIQMEPSEAVVSKLGLPNRRTFEVRWLVFFQTDPADPSDVGAVLMSDIIDAVERALYSNEPDMRQTLGGLVAGVHLGPEILKAAGDDTGEGIIAMSLSVVVP